MKSIPDSLTPSQAWKRLSAFAPLGVESKSLASALNHVLAIPFAVLMDVPSASRSFMDGFALRASDTAKPPARLRLTGEVLMGEIQTKELGPGEAMAIPTGGFLPPGADAVARQEDTQQPETGTVVVLESLVAGENVQVRGEDFRNGEVLCEAGHLLRPADLAAIATFGVTHVDVIRRPVLRMISTGNELVPHSDSLLSPGKIRETNALALCGAASKFQFESRSFGIVRDEFAAQREAMQRALNESDVVLVSGGSSVGERDYTLEVIQSFSESKIHFHGLAIRPGNPTIFASIGKSFVFGVPGQPVSSLIVFYAYVLPFLFHLSGERVDYETFFENKFPVKTLKLSKTILPLKSKTDYLRVRVRGDVCIPVPGKSASLSSLARADGFAIVPPGEAGISEGATLRVYLF